MTAHKQTTDGNPYTTGYIYNLSGALIEETYPSGRVVKNVLDNEGDLALVQSKKNAVSGFFNYAKNFTYTATGAVSSMQLGNGKWESTQFNSRLQPTQIALGTVQNGTDKLKLDYSYGTTGNNGNVLSQTITVPTVGTNQGFTALQTYTYDPLNRLKSATENIGAQTWKQTFLYDRYGNRNFDTANTTTLGSCPAAQCNPTVDAANNRFTTGQGYTFDLSGNLITDAEGRNFNYDAENKQASVSNTSGTIGTYLYDGDGKRVKKIVPNSETVIFVYDAAGKLVAEYSNQINQTPQVSYLTSDHLGSPRITTDANGQVISRRDFHPFGEEAFTAQRTNGLNYTADNTRQKFTGYERDNEIELDFAQARYYNPAHGRFTTTDPLMASGRTGNPQTWNRYNYVGNNPLVVTDPTGEDWLRSNVADENGQYTYHDVYGKELKKYLKGDEYSRVDFGGASSQILNRNGVPILEMFAKGGHREIATPSGPDALSTLVGSVAENAETKGRTVRMAATVAGVAGTCVGTAGAGCAGAIRLGTAYIEYEMEAAQTAAAADTVSADVHGNSLSSPRPTWVYELYDNDGNFLKNGITSQEKPENRYTGRYMEDKDMPNKKLYPNRRAARDVERRKNTVNPGPLNRRR